MKFRNKYCLHEKSLKKDYLFISAQIYQDGPANSFINFQQWWTLERKVGLFLDKIGDRNWQ